MATQIARVDGTVTVEIPEDLLRKANLSVGDSVEWSLTSEGTLALHVPSAAAAHESADYEEWKTEELKAGYTEIEAGEGVPNEKVLEWLRSWDAEHELPPPQ